MPAAPSTPIAIVGRGCVLPGASDPHEFWRMLRTGSDLLSRPPPGAWPIDSDFVTQEPTGPRWSDRGGYVGRFAFEPGGFAVDAEELLQADRCAHWVLHASRAALHEAGHDPARGHRRTGAILGHLSLPLQKQARFAIGVWLQQWAQAQGRPELARLVADPAPAAFNRYMSALPSRLMARALGLGEAAFTLDAACASSLYALKVACDTLAQGRADLMLAGAACGTDPMFLHFGFRALKALSPTGQSLPFDRRANGLVPAEGAVVLALKRLADAQSAGDRILGVIRGIGLSNDGGATGLLAPSSEGQVRAMLGALQAARLDPSSVALLECHATGTPVGDAVELTSIGQVYGAGGPVPIGSLKSQLGHLLAASGSAGLLKVLAAFDAGVLPRSGRVDEPIDMLGASPVRLLQQEEAWPASARRLAGISSFGFGGNNAHLLVEAYEAGAQRRFFEAPVPQDTPHLEAELAVVGLGVISGAAATTAQFARTLLDGGDALQEHPQLGRCGLAGDFVLAQQDIRFPPRDLADSLPQQVLVLKAAGEALAGVRQLPKLRTGVLAGMECDPEISRQMARGLAPYWLATWNEMLGQAVDEAFAGRMADAFRPPLMASGVVGCLPNIVANRINAQYRFSGWGHSVSADELSGLRALELGARALRHGELDAVVVAAVDLGCEPVNAQAAATLQGPGRCVPGDAAVVLVLKRLEDARRDGEEVLALLEPLPPRTPSGEHADALHFGDGEGALALGARFGHAHAASGLLHVAAAIVACQRMARPQAGPAAPWLAPASARRACVAMRAQGDQQAAVLVRAAPSVAALSPAHQQGPRAWCFAAPDRGRLIAALRAATTDGQGPARLAFVACPGEEFERQRTLAIDALSTPGSRLPPDMAHHEGPVGGEVAAVFTSAGSAYAGMGRDLLLACPDLLEKAVARLGNAPAVYAWIHDSGLKRSATPLEQLAGSSLLCQVHAALSSEVLRLQPQAAIGLSSGETNALIGLGAWSGAEGLFQGLEPLYATGLGGRFELLRDAWQQSDAQWTGWAVALPAQRVREALRDEQHAYLTMIYGPRACAIGGERGAIDRVVARLGVHHAVRVDHDFAVHCPEVLRARDTWRALHHRKTHDLAGVRFYTAAACGSYHAGANADCIADALLEMASGPVDFAAMVDRAWHDGVRVFVEHGPRDLCTRWIGDILRGREHLAVSLDDANRQPVRSALRAASQLWAAGVKVDVDALNRKLCGSTAEGPGTGAGICFASHMKPIAMPAWPQPAVPRAPVPPPAPAPAAAAIPTAPTTGNPMHVIAQASSNTRPQVAAAPALLWSRADLEEMSHGQLSKFFGPRFKAQDGHARQVRMPMPPLLLADRVMSIEGEPGSMGLGRIVTETDITPDAWYLHEGSMPAGLEVEAGQADLLLISYLGADLLNRGERVYRLLGCEMTYHGEQRPRVGDTLRYEIEVTGHAHTGDVRLFFFRYDSYLNGKLRLSVRNGRAGFFTTEELDNAGGVIWDPAKDGPDPSIRHAPGAAGRHGPRAFSREQVRAFTEGRAYDCFGAGFERAASHHRTPAIQGGPMQLFQQVEQFDPHGGPWGRGYLRATYDIRGDEWFFPGHFKNDPTMPGTLMCEAGVQMMGFYLAALGLTCDRDGWTFELVPGTTLKAVCRGQVVPTSRKMSYELLVRGLDDGAHPTLLADVLLTVDGRKAFHGRNLGVRLRPALPGRPFPPERAAPGARAPATVDGFTFDHASLMQCATGKPSLAFGPPFVVFDGGRNLPRLPSPPYHFISRVVRLDGGMGRMQVGSAVEVEYDIPQAAWYFDDNDGATMPYAVLMEAALQPCGWLTAYMGVPLQCDVDLNFRNLDGNGTLHRPVMRGDALLRTRACCTSVVRNGNVFIESFDVECHVGDARVYTLKTTFGHFPAELLAQQVGLPFTPAERQAVEQGDAAVRIDLHAAGEAATLPRLARGQLLMLDRVTGYWPQGGAAGRGRLLAQFDVDPRAWFFTAHFFRDPVQPGSLGVEAMVQLLQFHMRERGLGAGMRHARFEPVATGRPLVWKYRGQVLPTNRQVTVELEIAGEGHDQGGPWVSANAWLWVDGLRIYHAKDLCMRIVEGAA